MLSNEHQLCVCRADEICYISKKYPPPESNVSLSGGFLFIAIL